MRPAPPRGAVSAQFWFACAEFHDESVPDVSWLGPNPSECPTCANCDVEVDVQSPHVAPASSVPSAFDPVRMSCCTGDGDPLHWPLMRWPRSSTKTAASPLLACSAVRSAATVAPLAFTHGPVPMRERAFVGPFPLSGSCSTLRYARQVFEPAPAAEARFWQMVSAPRRPPRLPVVLVALVTKKLMVLPPGCGLGDDAPPPPHAVDASATRVATMAR